MKNKVKVKVKAKIRLKVRIYNIIKIEIKILLLLVKTVFKIFLTNLFLLNKKGFNINYSKYKI